MASWADRLAKTPDAVAEPAAAVATTEPEASYAVLDASALIGTTGSYKLADRCITTPDVYQEVRDKSSKHALASLPFGIEQREPDADSVATGEFSVPFYESFVPFGVKSFSSCTLKCLVVSSRLDWQTCLQN